MSDNTDEENIDFNEAREEALTQSEDPGQELDPLAEPAGSRGKQRSVGSEYEEEDARERPIEDGLDPEIPEDQNLHVSPTRDFEDELEDVPPLRDHSA